jgi:hypothetical protein
MFQKLSVLNAWLYNNDYIMETNRLSNIIKVAAKKDQLKKLYPGFDNEIDQLDAGMHVRYLEWSTEEVVDGNISVDEIIPIIQRFEKIKDNLPKRDINEYSSILSLRKVVKEFGQTPAEKRREEKRRVGEETDFIYKSDRFLVVNPKSTEASCFWGKGSKWCISADESNQYEHYSSQNIFFYFIIDKETSMENPMYRIALPMKNKAVYTEELRNAEDKSITIEEIRDSVGEEFESILSSIKKNQANKDYTEEYESTWRFKKSIYEMRISDILGLISGLSSEQKEDAAGALMDVVSEGGEASTKALHVLLGASSSFIGLYADKLNYERTAEIVPYIMNRPEFSADMFTIIIEKINNGDRAFVSGDNVLSILRHLKENPELEDPSLYPSLYHLIYKIGGDEDLAIGVGWSSDNFIRFAIKQPLEGGSLSDIGRAFFDEAARRNIDDSRRGDSGEFLYYKEGEW